MEAEERGKGMQKREDLKLLEGFPLALNKFKILFNRPGAYCSRFPGVQKATLPALGCIRGRPRKPAGLQNAIRKKAKSHLRCSMTLVFLMP